MIISTDNIEIYKCTHFNFGKKYLRSSSGNIWEYWIFLYDVFSTAISFVAAITSSLEDEQKTFKIKENDRLTQKNRVRGKLLEKAKKNI